MPEQEVTRTIVDESAFPPLRWTDFIGPGAFLALFILVLKFC